MGLNLGMFRVAVVALAALALPATTEAAALTADRECYIDAEGQVLNLSGAEWTPGSAWSVVGGGIDEAGVADGAGAFAFDTGVPVIGDGIKPRTFTLNATEDGTAVAKTSFKVVNFLVAPASIEGRPTGMTSWGFSGFTPAKPIYMHVKRGGKVFTQKAGRGDKVCGTLKTRLRRLPAVPARKIGFGTYKLFVDNRPKFRRGGLQYFATITIRKR